MDAGLNQQRSQATAAVDSHNEARRVKQDQITETIRTHLQDSVAQTEAHTSADAGSNTKPPDDDSYYPSIGKKVTGRPKGTRDASRIIRPNRPQIDKLRKVNDEMKKKDTVFLQQKNL